ncbi:hypothetical protein GGX14DRAFT_484250 [Mycena pura]|uniref:Non-specific serine/threonine protein kinase n=1 Tax=Mycena pura TaxID=153505 RepID=A0AAD6XXR1_9AGAR|nr:hypothetical protein GGX14DRAFT_484250 [Mycena pura]
MSSVNKDPTSSDVPPAPSSDHGPSHDFCNNFWGIGNVDVDVLFARVRRGLHSMQELQSFWRERASIEERYGSLLLDLVNCRPFSGTEKTGKKLTALEALVQETETQGTAHQRLASRIRAELEEPTTSFVQQLVAEEEQYQAPLKARYKSKHTAEAAMSKAREEYENNCLRLASYTQQMSVDSGEDAERLRAEIQKARETVQANEQDLSQATNSIRDVTMRWQKDWKEFCDHAQDGAEKRVEFLIDKVWAYANLVSTICVEDDKSCGRVRVALDDLKVPDEIEAFVDEYGTGNSMPEPLTWVPLSNGSPHIPQRATRPTQFVRVSTRSTQRYTKAVLNSAASSSANGRAPTTLVPPPPPPPKGPPDERPIMFFVTAQYDYTATIDEEFDFQAGDVIGVTATPDDGWWSGELLDDSRRKDGKHIFPSNFVTLKSSQAGLAVTSTSKVSPNLIAPLPTPVPPLVDEKRILFIVEALYDYTATIDEEFDFQAGDIIGVTATPDDGWWSGELLDDERRKHGKHIFPSNFVTLRDPQVTQTQIITSKVDPDLMSFKWKTLMDLRQQVHGTTLTPHGQTDEPVDSIDLTVAERLLSIERQLVSHLEGLVNSLAARAVVLTLRGEKAQQFLDIAPQILTLDFPDHLKHRAQTLLLNLARRSEQLPTTLFITDVRDLTTHALFGGAFGDVYRGMHGEQAVAVKRVRMFLDQGTPAKQWKKICREALVWQNLQHDFILPFLGVDMDTFSPAISLVSPWMKHGTILKYLQMKGREGVPHFIREIAEGVAYLHVSRIVHGDLRGANILVSDDHHALIGDFGLASVISDSDEDLPPGGLTTSTHAGNVRWWPPELCLPSQFGFDRFMRTPAADAWAFGCVCYEVGGQHLIFLPQGIYPSTICRKWKQ